MKLFLIGITIVVGFNVALAMRDSKGLNEIEERNQIIYKRLEVIPFSETNK
tara:strand:- start:269 stop:421 length:153 start_codon:yes stop_codon:yes gene_type:complete